MYGRKKLILNSDAEEESWVEDRPKKKVLRKKRSDKRRHQNPPLLRSSVDPPIDLKDLRKRQEEISEELAKQIRQFHIFKASGLTGANFGSFTSELDKKYLAARCVTKSEVTGAGLPQSSQVFSSLDYQAANPELIRMKNNIKKGTSRKVSSVSDLNTSEEPLPENCKMMHVHPFFSRSSVLSTAAKNALKPGQCQVWSSLDDQGAMSELYCRMMHLSFSEASSISSDSTYENIPVKFKHGHDFPRSSSVPSRAESNPSSPSSE